MHRLFVREIMQTSVITISPEELVVDAAQVMEDFNIRRLPVVDDDDFLVGIVTDTDILEAETADSVINSYDPDAPTGSGWWHWVAFNMPADTQGLAEGASGASMPEGTVESRTDFGSIGFGGACPPVGDKPHRYIVSVFALDTDRLDLDAQTPAAQVGYYLNAHTIEKAVLTGLYSR